MKNLNDRRQAFRMLFTPKVILHLSDSDVTFVGKACEISVAGLSAQIHNIPAVSGKCGVEIILEGKHSNITVNGISGTFKRQDDESVVIIFNEPFEWVPLVPIFAHKLPD